MRKLLKECLDYNQEERKGMHQPCIISVASGKGGVGKTLTVVHLALSFRRLGKKVLVFDGDLGMANIDVVLGLHPTATLYDVLEGTATLKEILLTGPLGIQIIPSGSGLASLQNLSYVQKQILLSQLSELRSLYDVLLLDSGAGIGDNVMHINGLADVHVIVTTPEPHAMTDAYAVMKVLSETKKINKFQLLVNMTVSEAEGSYTADRLSQVAKQYANFSISYLGHVPKDSVLSKKIFQLSKILTAPEQTISAQAWHLMARKLVTRFPTHSVAPSFWENLFYIASQP